MKIMVKATLLVLAGIAIGIGIVYAVDITPSWNHNIGASPSTLHAWGWEDAPDTMVIDNMRGEYHIRDRTFFWLSDALVAMTSDDAAHDRGAFVVEKYGDESAMAYMEGSGGGKVECDTTGDVIITLGN